MDSVKALLKAPTSRLLLPRRCFPCAVFEVDLIGAIAPGFGAQIPVDATARTQRFLAKIGLVQRSRGAGMDFSWLFEEASQTWRDFKQANKTKDPCEEACQGSILMGFNYPSNSFECSSRLSAYRSHTDLSIKEATRGDSTVHTDL